MSFTKIIHDKMYPSLTFSENILLTVNYDIYIPGQLSILHVVFSKEAPAQLLPPPDGVGLVHVLVLDICPTPHVLEQDEYVPHSLHWPFTEI